MSFLLAKFAKSPLKNILFIKKSESRQKNFDNGWKDEKEKKMAEHFQPNY